MTAVKLKLNNLEIETLQPKIFDFVAKIFQAGTKPPAAWDVRLCFFLFRFIVIASFFMISRHATAAISEEPAY